VPGHGVVSSGIVRWWGGTAGVVRSAADATSYGNWVTDCRGWESQVSTTTEARRRRSPHRRRRDDSRRGKGSRVGLKMGRLQAC
jgi:hypothetical protein